MGLNDKYENNNNYIQLSELTYLCFFGIMFFAKGIGLYDGQFLYKIILLSAFSCLAFKMIITKHSYLEWGIILGVLGFSTIIYMNSGEKGILICTAMIIGMKNVTVDKVFRLGLIIWCISAGGIFIYSLININNVRMEVQHKLEQVFVPRYFMGFPHPNVLHISYFVLVLLFLYVWKEKYQWNHLFVLMLGNIFIFIYSFSITGFAVVTFLLFMALYIKLRIINLLDYGFVKTVLPLCLLISVALPVFANGKVLQIADKVFNHRIGYSKHFLQWDNITLIGNSLVEITDAILAIDNSFVFALIIYGILIFVCIVLAYWCLVTLYIKEKKNIELAIIVSYFIAGITEPLLFNTSFKNLTLVFIGAMIFEKVEQYGFNEVALLKQKDIKISIGNNTRKKWEKLMGDNRYYIPSKYLYMSLLCSIFFSVMFALQKKIPIRILQRREEEVKSLILFEKIRCGATTFIIVYILLVLVIYFNINRKKEDGI